MTDKEKLKEIKSLADKMYYSAFNMTTDASLLRKAMDEYRQFIINEYHKEEPVSEGLEDAAHEYANIRMSNYETAFYAFMSGAQWQKQQDQSTIELAEDHAMLAGMEKMKEEMMAKAIDGEYWDNNIILEGGIRGMYDDGDKVKVIVIKEE